MFVTEATTATKPSKLIVCRGVCVTLFDCTGGPPWIPLSALLEEPGVGLVTDVYRDLFVEEVDGRFVRAMVIDDRLFTELEIFIEENHLRKEILPGHYELSMIHAYQSMEFGENGTVCPVVRFATVPTIAVSKDGQIETRSLQTTTTERQWTKD